MEYVSIFLGVLLYLIVALLIIGYVNKKLENSWWIIRYFVKTFLFALFFGLGMIPGAGDPGFNEVAPIPLAAWYANSSNILNNVIFPFVFWWIAIFLAMVVSRKIMHQFN